MVQLIITLDSGVQVVYVTDPDVAEANVQLIRASWEQRSGVSDLVLGSEDGTTDWVRLAHVSAVRIAPAVMDEQGQDVGTE